MKHTAPTPAQSSKCNGLNGTLKIPGDKSISHRSLIVSSQLLGNTTIYGMLEGEDVLCTAHALRLSGVDIQQSQDAWHVKGVGIGGLSEPDDVMDMGNSGTSTRLLAGLFSSYPFLSVFTGDNSLRKRPMKRVVTPLSLSGAQFMPNRDMTLPLAMKGSELSLPIDYTLPVASAQVKSAIMLAALNIKGTSTIIEPVATRDHTERMFSAMDIPVEVTHIDGETHISVTGCPEQHFTNREIHVPADPSSAAFLTVAALIVPNSHIIMNNICINDTRIGIYTTLLEMGAQIDFTNKRIVQGEPVADIEVRSSQLEGVTIPASRAPSMIDEYPVLAIAASVAQGKTIMQNLHELRVKESNRFDAIVNGLNACGVDVQTDGDTISVTGTTSLKGGAHITTNLDHRIAMSYLVMGLVTQQPVTVDDVSAINTSFPEFINLMRHAGAHIQCDTALPVKRALTVAIDGPAASGKGTLARRVAQYLGVKHLDTGGLYRAAALKLLSQNGDPHNIDDAVHAATHIDYHDLANIQLRSEHVGNTASIISAIPEVRTILLDFQRNFANNAKGAVLDGRDIGTVVCPQADVKIFITASIEARAKRRHKQLQNEGIEVVYESVLQDLKERDERDSARNIAPLKAADNALKIDTTSMTVDEVFKKVIELLER